jgi:uncharacterized protein
MGLLRTIGWLGILFWLAGCATYAHRVRNARNYFEAGNYELSIAELKKFAEEKGKDELLYLMDLGTVYHTAGRYAEAVQVFRKAADLSEIKDYTSLAAEAGAVLLNDEVKGYRGEDFEKVLVHVYLALDYTALKQWDDALVECRLVNHILDRMISEGKLPYQHNAFAKYLAALLFEAQRDYNAAFVDYRTMLKWAPSFPYLAIPLKRVADKLQASQELEEYEKRFPEAKNYRLGKNEGEIVLIVEQGKGPIKVPSPQFHLVPTFVRRPGFADHFELRVGKAARGLSTFTLFDIESTAVKELEGKIAGIIVKKMAGVAAKQLIAQQVAKATKDEGWGTLTAMVLHGSDQADLRSWTTLPAKLALLRMPVPAGRHDLVLDMVSTQGSRLPVRRWAGIEVRPGEKIFLMHRSME